jgi:hypothetical protein
LQIDVAVHVASNTSAIDQLCKILGVRQILVQSPYKQTWQPIIGEIIKYMIDKSVAK